MSILLSIIESPKNCMIKESSKKFSEQGGTIGRGSDNAWVLHDPECFLSSCHSEISFENGIYILADLSTNGTFLNGSSEPIGKGNKVQLKDGYEIELSNYKFKINILDFKQKTLPPVYPEQSTDNPLNEEQSIEFGDPFAINNTPKIESMLTPIAQETDPLAVLGNSDSSLDSTFNNADSTDAIMSTADSNFDQTGVINQQIDWPKSTQDSGVIPEDWDILDDSEDELPFVVTHSQIEVAAVVPAPQKINNDNRKHLELAQENINLKNELKNAKQQLLTVQCSKNSANSTSADMSIIKALGMEKFNFDSVQIIELNKIIGGVVKETVSGIMQVLSSRNSIKNEFRMNVTKIQAVENNPLKFSANVDDALENMFFKKGSSYKNPIDSIRDAFNGINEHQLAILAGIRAAFKDSLERFEPNSLEKRFKRNRKNKGFSKTKKAKNWDDFVTYYNELTRDSDKSFQFLLGDSFSHAYEEQLKRLIHSRNLKI